MRGIGATFPSAPPPGQLSEVQFKQQEQEPRLTLPCFSHVGVVSLGEGEHFALKDSVGDRHILRHVVVVQHASHKHRGFAERGCGTVEGLQEVDEPSWPDGAVEALYE